MSGLIYSAMSGLSVAQAALVNTSNNISNYTVAGYTRRTLLLEQANSTLQGNSYFGNGVTISGVQREYDKFITAQLRGASAGYNATQTQFNQISGIDKLFSTSTSNLSSSMQKFFTNVQNVVSNTSDASARQSLLTNANGMVNQFQTAARYLSGLQTGVNNDISSSVDQINAFSSQIATLNEQINKLTTGNNASPNDLLDQRDLLVSKLNAIAGVNVTQQDGSYIVSMGSVTLVNGRDTTRLVAVPSGADSTRMTVGYADKQAGNVEIPENMLDSGSLGGLLKFRREDLDKVQNQLGQLAAAFTSRFNAVHSQGFDSAGKPGQNFFNIGSPSVASNSKNTSSATINAEWSDASALKASDYKVTYDGTNWSVTRMSDNVKLNVKPDPSDGKLHFDGMKLTITGSPDAKDSFIIKPVKNVIDGMSVAIKDQSQIASASSATGGMSDNRNIQKLLDIQNVKLVNGNATLNGAYAIMVSDIGNKTSSLQTTTTTQKNVVIQLSERQQSVSGVNLDEEYANLTKFQQYYMANAQVLKTANTIFDALMGIRG